jgi:hypothetical protein
MLDGIRIIERVAGRGATFKALDRQWLDLTTPLWQRHRRSKRRAPFIAKVLQSTLRASQMNALLFDIVRHQSSCARNWHFVAVRRRLVIERLRREQFRPRMTTFTQEEPKLVTLSAPLLLDAPPESDQLTEYDRAHFTMYLRLVSRWRRLAQGCRADLR